MGSVTKLQHETSEQHVEMSVSRKTRDNKDINVIITLLRQFYPFLLDSRLRCITTGAVAVEGDGINCDEVEEIGIDIHKDLDGVSVSQAVVKRSKQLKNLAQLSTGVKVNSEILHINETVLFQRLIVLIERSEDMSTYFEYELTPTPTSLFKDDYMRKSNKSILGKALTQNSTKFSESFPASKYVIDGGALLHRVYWNVPATYQDIVQQYCSYVTRKYGEACSIIFDGYESSTKDQEHERRTKNSFIEIVFQLQNEVHCKQAEFLSNEKNKTRLIENLSTMLRGCGHTVNICTGDADLTIVECALQLAEDGLHTTVVADDTDILVLLLNMWTPRMSDILLRHEARKSIKKDLEIFSIKENVDILSDRVVKNLLFIHAWSGCDTTSATFSHGKTQLMKIVERNLNVIEEICSVFTNPLASQDEISSAGIRLFLYLYGNYNLLLQYVSVISFSRMMVDSIIE